MKAETALSYPALLIDGHFTRQQRDHQYNEAYKNGLPFFTVTVKKDHKPYKGMYWLHLQGEMVTGQFRDIEAMTEFLLMHGFIRESINFTPDGKLYADQAEQRVNYMYYIARMLMHFQIKGEWLDLEFRPADYPES